MSNWGGIKSRMACSTQESYNQSWRSAFYCSRSVETRSSSIPLRILPSWQFRSTYWPDDQFNMSNLGGIKWRMACCTLESCNWSCWSALCWIAIVETIFPPANALRISLPWQFRSTYWSEDQFNMSNWGGITWRMACSTHQSCNQSSWSAFCCRAIVETIFPPARHWKIQKHLLIRRSIQHGQLGWN